MKKDWNDKFFPYFFLKFKEKLHVIFFLYLCKLKQYNSRIIMFQSIYYISAN